MEGVDVEPTQFVVLCKQDDKILMECLTEKIQTFRGYNSGAARLYIVQADQERTYY